MTVPAHLLISGGPAPTPEEPGQPHSQKAPQMKQPDCETCRGACCEEFFIPVGPAAQRPGDDVSKWFALHATEEEGNLLRFECKCTKLTDEGQCSIYAKRPIVCQKYKRGGADCVEVLQRRRPLYWRYLSDGF